MRAAAQPLSRQTAYPVPGPHPDAVSRLWGGSLPHSCAEVDAREPAPRVEQAVRRADALAMSVGAAVDRIVAPLACAAEAFVTQKAWFEFGHARLEDHARERFGRSARWVRDLARVSEAMRRLPCLASALAGDDGARPLGRVAALLVARVASVESAAVWVAMARREPVSVLREAVTRARAAGSCWPVGSTGTASAEPGRDTGADNREATADSDAAGAPPPSPDAVEDDAPRELVRLLLPVPVASAFDETLDLYRAVEGHESTVTSFVEALVAEAMSGELAVELACDLDRVALQQRDPAAAAELALSRATSHWSHLPDNADASLELARAGASLARFEELSRVAGQGDAAALDSQLRDLIEIEDQLERRLGALLREMSELGAWRRLGFTGCAHYAEQRLGMSRSAAGARLQAARDLEKLPLVRQAYESGAIRLEPALHIKRILTGAPAATTTGTTTPSGDALQQAWVELAREASTKRMRDEARLWRRNGQMSHAPPCDDAAWQDSLRREPGLARTRVQGFGRLSAAAIVKGGSGTFVPDVFLRLRLPSSVATDLLTAIEAARRRLAARAASIPWDQPWPEPDPPASLLAARAFDAACRRPPAWVGLLALLEEFVATWDVRLTQRPAPGEAVLARDGCRCTAPACTSRRHLQVHHIDYRSRGGGDAMANLTGLCLFHHRRGEHGDLMTCRGTAPLGITFRLGRDGLGGWFRNERRLAA